MTYAPRPRIRLYSRSTLPAIALAFFAAIPLGGIAASLEAVPAEVAKAAPKLEWLKFDAAAAEAAKQNKHMIVDVYTTWCGWCKVMDRQTYGNPEVANYLAENFVLAKVNGESPAKLTWQGRSLAEKDFARIIGVRGYPGTYFLKPSAEMLGGLSGYIRAPDFLIYAQYVNTEWYLRGKLQDFADSVKAIPPQP